MSELAGDHHIILVEDNDDHAELAEFHLRHVAPQARVERFEDGDSVATHLLELARTAPSALPDLVLLDLKLPRLDGLGVLERVRAEPMLASLPIVMLTTSDADHDKAAAYRNHVNGYVAKPASFQDFRALMNGLLTYWLQYNRVPRRHAS